MDRNENRYADDIYGRLQKTLETGLQYSEDVDYTREGYGPMDYFFLRLKGKFQANWGTMLAGILFTIVGVQLVWSLYRLGMATVNVAPGYLSSSPAKYIFWAFAPFVVWLYSTLYDHWNFFQRKKKMMMFCAVNLGVQMCSILFIILYYLLTPLFDLIPINRDISVKMVLSLARVVMLGVSALGFIAFVSSFHRHLSSPVTQKRLREYKLGKHLDLRRGKKYNYDMNIVARLDNGKRHVIKMKDRFLHALANGVTGTGKTSTCFTVSISNDIDQSIINREYQKKNILKKVKKGELIIKEPFSDDDFSADYFAGTDKKSEKWLQKLKAKAPIAGISAMAPNAAFADEIFQLAKAKGRKVNRLDPVMSRDGVLKEGYIGFNPLYISPEINPVDTPYQWVLEVSNTAIGCANVMQSVYDASGTSDVYFASLNRNITTALTMLLILTYPSMHGGKQPTLIQLQEILNDFSKAAPYRKQLLELYGTKNEDGTTIMRAGKADVGWFQMVYDVVDSEILGKGAEKMFEQARGLRVIVNTILNNPSIRNILCCEKTIDLDRALARGEVTVVNYALEYDSAGIAFGLFYLLSFISAVERRPGTERTRVPHFFYVDELPVLMHPKVEHCITMFRQYRVATFAAVQSLAQMKKSNSTAFLKDVFVGNCGHHFVFGRSAAEEMELYEKIAGQDFVMQEQSGRSETSMLENNPHVSISTRKSMVRESRFFGDDIRNRDAQEVTVVTVDNGSPVGVFLGKTSFLPKYKRVGKRHKSVDWSQWYHFTESKEASTQEKKEEEIDMDILKRPRAKISYDGVFIGEEGSIQEPKMKERQMTEDVGVVAGKKEDSEKEKESIQIQHMSFEEDDYTNL